VTPRERRRGSIWTVVDQVPRLVTLIRSVLTEREAAATASDRG
jgi:hypothetical protein